MTNTNDEIRAAAGAAIEKLIRSNGTNVISWSQIDEGFQCQGTKIHFATKAQGIFKPAVLSDGAALSIRQARPSRAGRTAAYDDRELNEGLALYHLQREGGDSHRNRPLLEAYQRQTPLIYFRGLSDALYEVFYPVFVRAVNLNTLEAVVALANDPEGTENTSGGLEEEPLEKGYGTGTRRTRLHQKAFRQRVLLAYGLRCALTNLPLTDLLELPTSSQMQRAARHPCETVSPCPPSITPLLSPITWALIPTEKSI